MRQATLEQACKDVSQAEQTVIVPIGKAVLRAVSGRVAQLPLSQREPFLSAATALLCDVRALTERSMIAVGIALDDEDRCTALRKLIENLDFSTPQRGASAQAANPQHDIAARADTSTNKQEKQDDARTQIVALMPSAEKRKPEAIKPYTTANSGASAVADDLDGSDAADEDQQIYTDETIPLAEELTPQEILKRKIAAATIEVLRSFARLSSARAVYSLQMIRPQHPDDLKRAAVVTAESIKSDNILAGKVQAVIFAQANQRENYKAGKVMPWVLTEEELRAAIAPETDIDAAIKVYNDARNQIWPEADPVTGNRFANRVYLRKLPPEQLETVLFTLFENSDNVAGVDPVLSFFRSLQRRATFAKEMRQRATEEVALADVLNAVSDE